jgi:hypothetical protein
MCPDKQLLSVYHDDELPSPWKEKMEAHLACCDRCRKTVAVYGKLSSLLAAPLQADASEAPCAAAWTRVREKWRSVDRPETKGQVKGGMLRRRVFGRQVAVPLPFAVAAAAALVFAFAALLTQGRGVQPIPETGVVAAGIDLEPEEIRQVTSIDDALRFIENNEFFTGPQSSYVIMRLPENKTFYNVGNPQIQNAPARQPKRTAGRAAPTGASGQ